jgi:superfamily II DNA or RNA helicase
VLRPYQAHQYGEVRAVYRDGYRRVLLVAPTGSGKTVVFAHAAARAEARGSIVVIGVHRIELLDQTIEKLRDCGIDCGVIAAGQPENYACRVQVALIPTLVQRIKKRGQFENIADLVIADEAHHCVAKTWLATIPKVLSRNGYLLGVTATPERLDGRGLGEIFDVMVEGVDYDELYAGGYLVKPVTFAPEFKIDLSSIQQKYGDYDPSQLAAVMMDGRLIGDAIDHYRRLCNGGRALVYCCSIAHSEKTAAAFREVGFSARHVDGNTPAAERRAAAAGLADGTLRVLCNVSLYGEGVDLPALEAIISLRPTRSRAWYRQMCGRVVRPMAGKCQPMILDHAGNVFRLGLFDAPMRWSLNGKRRLAPQSEDAPVKHCQACGAVNPLAVQVCGNCGEPLVIGGRGPPEEVPGELAAIDNELVEKLRQMAFREVCRWAGGDLARLRQVQIAKGYQPGWIHKQWIDWFRGGSNGGHRSGGDR